MHPRRLLLPCLLTLALLALPGRALADFSAFSVPSTCPGAPGADLGVTATDGTTAPTGWQGSDITVTLTGTGVAQVQWMINCGTPQTGPDGQTVVFNVSGPPSTLSHRVKDSNGLWTAWVDDTIQLDKTVPSNTSTIPSGWTNLPVPVTISGSDTVSGVNHVEYNLDGGGVQSVPSGTTFNVTGDGVHTLDTLVEDNAGNRSGLLPGTVRIDTVNPVDQTVVPSVWQYTPTTITFSGSDALSGINHVEWKVNGGSVQSGANGATQNFGDGTYSIDTRVVDQAGNATGWTTRTLQVDTTGPQDLTAVPSLWQQTSPVDITVTGVDPLGIGIDHVEWELDSVPGSGPNGSVVHVSGDGVHELKTRVVDAAVPARSSGWNTRYVRIDTVTPTDSTSTSSGWYTAPQTVPVTGYDAHSGIQKVEWKIDGNGTQSSNGNPANVAVSGDGTHTLITRVYDNAGNVSGYKTNYVRIDGSAPVNQTPVADPGWRNTQYAVVLAGADSVSGMKQMHYVLDGGPDQTGPSQLTTAVVSGTGTHTLRTYAEDVAGNFSGYRDETIKIDMVAPLDTTVGPGGPVTNNYPITLSGTDAHSGINVIQYKLDGGAVQSAPTGSTVIISGAGPHTLETQATDNAGNVSGYKTTTITVDPALSGDTTPPTDTTTTPSAWQTSDYTLTLAADDGSGVGIDYMKYRVDGQPISGRVAPGTHVQITGDGVHDVETIAYDLVGNHSDWKPLTVKIDTTVPADTTNIKVAPDWVNSRDFVLSGTDATSGVASIAYQVDGGSALTVANGGTVTLPSDGNHTIRHRVVDAAGQASGWTTSAVRIDTVAPANTSAAAPTGWQTSSGVSLALTGTDALSGVDHVEWRVDGGTASTGSPAVVDSDGVQLLETRVVDRAGNDSGWRQETVKIDRTAPANTTPVPSSGWLNTTFSTVVSGTDATSGVAGVEWKVDSGAVSTTTAVSVAAAGAHTLYTRIRDGAGNWSAWRPDSVGIDKVVPTLTASCGSADWRNAAAVCSVSADGGASGLATLTATREGAAAEAVSGGSYTVSAEGATSLTFRAVDGAGNEKLALASVKLDLTPPSAGVSCAAGAGTSYVCTASGSDALSGLSSLAWSVDGSPPAAIANGGTFSVAKGVVTVTALDRAGNGAASPAVTLKERKAPSTGTTKTKPQPVPRTASRAVLRRGKGTVAARALGQLEISALPESTTATLRPLALGKGSFQVSLKVTADKKSKSVTKKVTSKAGYSPQIVVKVGGAVDVTVKLTVKKKTGRRWVAYATGTTRL